MNRKETGVRKLGDSEYKHSETQNPLSRRSADVRGIASQDIFQVW
jgi:hypothetical protein